MLIAARIADYCTVAVVGVCVFSVVSRLHECDEQCRDGFALSLSGLTVTNVLICGVASNDSRASERSSGRTRQSLFLVVLSVNSVILRFSVYREYTLQTVHDD